MIFVYGNHIKANLNYSKFLRIRIRNSTRIHEIIYALAVFGISYFT